MTARERDLIRLLRSAIAAWDRTLRLALLLVAMSVLIVALRI